MTTNISRAYYEFCTTKFPLPSAERVAELEKQLGIALPAEYRQFLLDFNGGIFNEPQIEPSIEGCPTDRLTFLKGIAASTPVAELGSDVDLFDDNDPPHVLPIGATLMGNLLYMVTDPDDECPGWIGLKLAFRRKSFWLADDIESFFGLLRKPS